jgi:hypothetical protein
VKSSDQIDQLAAALAIAQGQFVNPPRNRSVSVTLRDNKGKYDFTYATLDCIMDVVRGPLSANGLALVHAMDSDAEGPVCETRLIHSSGQWIATWVPVLVAKDANAQGWGSAISYARRYGVCILLSLAADEDSDANHAIGNDARFSDRRPAPKQQPKPAPKPTQPTQSAPTASTTVDRLRIMGGMLHEM